MDKKWLPRQGDRSRRETVQEVRRARAFVSNRDEGLLEDGDPLHWPHRARELGRSAV